MEGVSQLSIDKLLSYSTKKLRRGIFLCFRQFVVWEKTVKRGVYHDFLSKFFSLKVPKDFVGNRFLFQRISALK